MHLKKKDLEEAGRIWRLNLINSISGIKPANLIGTISGEGITNLAIFSSVVHLGSSPAMLGFILRPSGEVRRHTYENILNNGYYTINHVHEDFADRAHYTSAKFKESISEFTSTHLTEEYRYGFKAPFVKESQLKIGMKFLQEIPIPLNDTRLIIGEVQHLILPDNILDEEGHADLSLIGDVGISGLNSYYRLEKIGRFPYARPDETPDFREQS